MKKYEKTLLEDAIEQSRYRESTPTHQVDHVRRSMTRRTWILFGLCSLLAAAFLCWLLAVSA